MHSVQAGSSLEENVQQLYHNGLSVEDYSTAVNYSSQLNAQQAVQQQQSYATSGSAVSASTAGPAAQHSSHSHSGGAEQHVNSNSAHALLTAATSSQLHTQSQRSQQPAASHAPANQPVSSYYYSHLHSQSSHHHPSHSSQSAPNANQLHARQTAAAGGQQTAASLLHQHQQSQGSYHSSSHVQPGSTSSNNQLNQLNQLVASADQQLQSMTAGGSSCPMPTAVSAGDQASSSVGNSTASNSATTMGNAHPTMCKSGNNSNSSIINLIINNGGPDAGSSVMVNGNADGKACKSIKQPTNGDHTKSLPNSPGQLNKQSRSSPNAGQHPAANQLSISPNGEQLLTASNSGGKQPYPSTASVLIEGLTELDLVNSVNGGQPHLNSHQQPLTGEQQSSVSPLIVVNCNNSLSSNNSNFTDDTVVTYQQHQNNSHNSITLTDLNAHYQSQIAMSPCSQQSKCSPTGVDPHSGELQTGFKKMKTGRGRSKKQVSPDPESANRRVFIWDLDETLIILNSLLNGVFANENQKVRIVWRRFLLCFLKRIGFWIETNLMKT